MTKERPPEAETIGPGRLYFLAHPESQQFSGYGLTTIAGRRDRLTGLVMVDRPNVVDSAWLDRVEAQYGDYQLVPMTATGERGILAQMRIEPESRPFLERFDHPIAQDLKRVLAPFLDEPPSPIFKLRWNAEQRLWRSEFWIGLPSELQDVFEENGYGCLAVERTDGTVAFATHLPAEEMESLRDAPVVYDWQFVPMPMAPLIRFYAALLDDPYRPYQLEHFLNVGDPEQVRCLAQLIEQPTLSFDVYGQEYEYAYSKEIAHPAALRDRLAWLAHLAEEWEADILTHARDFDRAKAQFQGHVPL
jgi:hypothetical protein